MTWREVESAFNYLFDRSYEDEYAKRIMGDFRRARSQLLPLFSNMVVSPYETERAIGLTVLEKVGGRTTVKFLDDILADDTVYEAFKPDIRQLRDELDARARQHPDPEDEAEEADELDLRGERVDEGEDEGLPDELEEGEPAAPVEPAPTRAESAPEPPRVSRAPLSAEVFEGPPEAFLAALEGHLPSLVTAFGALPEGKRLSFLDRAAKLRDPRLERFLGPLLETTDWAVIHSALQAVQKLELVAVLPQVKALAKNAQRKRVRERAERVAAALSKLTPGDETVAPKPTERPKPKPLGKKAQAPEPAAPAEPARPAEPAKEGRRGRRERQADDAPARREGAPFGLAAAPSRPYRPAAEPWQAPDKLPKLQGCLATGVDLYGRQTMAVYRSGADGGLDRLVVRLQDGTPEVDLGLREGLPGDTFESERGLADLVAVPAGYVRARMQEAVGPKREGDHRDWRAALAYLGSAKKVETEAAADGELPQPTQEPTEQLLDHPLCAGWRIALDPRGDAVDRWLQTGRKRSAARHRRRLIDEAVEAWLEVADAATMAHRLRQQALLLLRGGEAELAAVALGLAAQLIDPGHKVLDNLLLRELAYRGFSVGVREHRELAQREARHEQMRQARTKQSKVLRARSVRRRRP